MNYLDNKAFPEYIQPMFSAVNVERYISYMFLQNAVRYTEQRTAI
jgi:hypothetical protein